MHRYCFSLFIVTLLCGLTIQLSSASVQSVPEGEEYLVFSAIISRKYINKGNELILIEDKTRADTFEHDSLKRDAEYVLKNLPPLARNTLEDYRNKNRNVHTLGKHFNIKVPYLLFGLKESKEVFKNEYDDGKEFHKRYRDAFGIIQFSRVGFNTDMNQALVYIRSYCGSLCGSGNYLLLTKENGN